MFSAGIISYSGEKKFKIPYWKVAGALSNFPVVINPADLWATTLAQAQSLRLYQWGVEIARDVITKNKARFKAGSLSDSVDNVFTYTMDWVSSDYGASDTYGRNNVYTAYKAFYDFASGNSNDRTGNGYNGTDSNITYSGDYASFNGSSSKIINSSYNTKSYIAIGNTIATNKLCTYVNDAVWRNQWSTTITTNTFHQLWYTYNGTTVSHIEDGSIADTFSRSWWATKSIVSYCYPTRVSSENYVMDSDNANIQIWYRNGSGWYEWRIYSLYIKENTLSSSRITTEYTNQSDPSSFITVL